MMNDDLNNNMHNMDDVHHDHDMDEDENDGSIATDGLNINVSVDDLYKHNWHVGSYTKYRNKYMEDFVYKSHNGIDIIDIAKSKVILENTLKYLRNAVMKGKKVLFVGTNPHASKAVEEHAERCGQYYISKKWFGGLLTNWPTFADSIKKMNALYEMIENNELSSMTKKERLSITRKVYKHRSFMRGIKDMDSVPNIVIIVSPKEKTALKEVKRMRSLPLVSILLADTNTDPTDINNVVPGNTESIKAVNYFCELCANACLQGLMDEEKLMHAKQEEKQSEDNSENHTEEASESKE